MLFRGATFRIVRRCAVSHEETLMERTIEWATGLPGVSFIDEFNRPLTGLQKEASPEVQEVLADVQSPVHKAALVAICKHIQVKLASSPL
jgi:hypothetical protein